jgi:uncharacterized protein
MNAARHPALLDADDRSDAAVLAAMQRWLERAVIGAGLCPFAKAVHVKRQIRWVVSAATDTDALLEELGRELLLLADADPEAIDTTLLIHPHVLQDFLDFNDFLDIAEAAVEALGLDGELQVASFHPDYVFADAAPDDPSHASNRAPFPTLHLLREASVDRAVAAFPDADTLAERNIETLRRLGHAGWRALFD